MELVHGRLATARKLRVLTIVDIFSRFSPALEPRLTLRHRCRGDTGTSLQESRIPSDDPCRKDPSSCRAISTCGLISAVSRSTSHDPLSSAQVTMDMIWKLSAKRVAAPQSRLTVLLCVRRGARVTQETGGAISLFRRTSRAGIGMGTDELTFTRLQFMDQ